MNEVAKLQPEEVFRYFYELTQIPRCSGNEEAVSNYLKKFAEDRGLEVYQDDHWNIIIRKKATEGFEASPGVILQAHMDMVCEKTDESDHDFCKDPLDVAIDGEYVYAKGTTLGADDGIGVAMALAILDDETAEHPDLEVLVTTNEETGMDGAIALDKSLLHAKRMINIDSEEEGFLCCGCAGGVHATLHFPLKRVSMDEKEKKNSMAFNLRVEGLKGGHSGVEINTNHSNGMKVLFELYRKIFLKTPLQVLDFISGTKHNAIPTSGEIKVLIDAKDEDAFKEAFESVRNEMLEAQLKKEPDIKFIMTKSQVDEDPFAEEDIKKLVSAIELLPHGIHSMMQDRDIVESSDNLAILRLKGDEAVVTISLRSSSHEALEAIKERIEQVADFAKARLDYSDGYPGWEYEEHSVLRDVFAKTYQEVYGEEIAITVIHAGLECGLFAEAVPEMDMVSFGPDIEAVHTTNERLSIPSTQRSYKLLKEVLKALK